MTGGLHCGLRYYDPGDMKGQVLPPMTGGLHCGMDETGTADFGPDECSRR